MTHVLISFLPVVYCTESDKSSTRQYSRTTNLNVLLFLFRDPHCISYYSSMLIPPPALGREWVFSKYSSLTVLIGCSRISWEDAVPFSAVFLGRTDWVFQGYTPTLADVLVFQDKSAKTRFCPFCSLPINPTWKKSQTNAAPSIKSSAIPPLFQAEITVPSPILSYHSIHRANLLTNSLSRLPSLTPSKKLQLFSFGLLL